MNRHPVDERDPLGTALAAIADEIDVPDTDLVPLLRDEIDELVNVETRRPVQRRRTGRSAGIHRRGLLVAAAVVVAFTVVVVYEPSRDAVAGWLGLGGTTVEYRGPGALPVPGYDNIELGVPIELTTADRTPIPTLGPAADAYQGPGTTSLVWVAGASLPELSDTGLGVILTRRPAGNGLLTTKLVADSDPVESVDVGGVSGLWIPGDHVLLEASGRTASARRVLLWAAGDWEYRLETNLELDEVLDLAEQVDWRTQE